MASQPTVIKAAWTQHREVLQQIREVVFIDEQQVPREIEWDGADAESTHFLCQDADGAALGCARLLPSGQIGRMAVLAHLRGQGIGALLLAAAVREGVVQGYSRLFLHAQQYAEDFYRKGGFVPYGEPFEEAGIPHIAMEMRLRPASDSTTAASAVNETTENASAVSFTDSTAAVDQLLRVANRAQRQLWVRSALLDPQLFEDAAVIEQLSAFARSAAKAEVRILIADSQALLRRGHRLLDLSRRLDEKILLRVLSEPDAMPANTYLCADHRAYWRLANDRLYSGIGDTNDSATCRRLRDHFEQAWARSHRERTLGRLHI